MFVNAETTRKDIDLHFKLVVMEFDNLVKIMQIKTIKRSIIYKISLAPILILLIIVVPVLIYQRFFVLEIHAQQAYLELYMADPEVRVSQKVYCQIGNILSTDRLEAKHDNNLIFQKNANLRAEEIFVVDYRNQMAGNHSLTVEILTKIIK